MSYNTDLQTNNTNLQSILETINNLPAGKADPILQDKTVTPSASSQIVTADSNYDGLNIVTVTGDTNLVASNIKNGTSIFGVSGTYIGSGSGDTDMEDKLVTRNLTSYINDRVEIIGEYAFYNCSKLATVSFPNATSIGISAFYSCFKLTTVSFPNAISINGYAFKNCTSLATVSFPNATSIGYNAFNNCSKLATVSFPKVTTIGSSAFDNCSKLTKVSFPNAISINEHAFYDCTSLATASFPQCTKIDNNAFKNCSKLTTVSFPNVATISYSTFENCTSLATVSFPNATNIGFNAFYNCSKLATVSFPNATSIGNSAFKNCTSLATVSFPNVATIGICAFENCTTLSSIYLTGSVLCSLNHSNAFSKTGIWNNMGSIFVPASLVTSYKTAMYWSYFSSRIFDIDGQGGNGNDEAVIISFSIDGNTYQAEEGMTWGQWCDSEYNTSGIYIDTENYVYTGTYWVWEPDTSGAMEASSAETKYSVIINECAYVLDDYASLF